MRLPAGMRSHTPPQRFFRRLPSDKIIVRNYTTCAFHLLVMLVSTTSIIRLSNSFIQSRLFAVLPVPHTM
jgi:hypothetical protein